MLLDLGARSAGSGPWSARWWRHASVVIVNPSGTGRSSASSRRGLGPCRRARRGRPRSIRRSRRPACQSCCAPPGRFVPAGLDGQDDHRLDSDTHCFESLVGSENAASARSPIGSRIPAGALHATQEDDEAAAPAAASKLARSASDRVGDGHEHALRELGEPGRVAPLVVVPGDDLDLCPACDEREAGVEDRREPRLDHVRRDERLVAVLEDPGQLVGRRPPPRTGS